nr:MATE family efflux transporter [Clostridia bacterium]
RFRDWFVTDKTLFRDFIKAGFPMLFSGASWGLAMFAQSAITGRLGSDAIAASSIAGAVYSVLSVIYASSANASSVIIAKTVGEGDVGKVKNAAKLFQLVFLALGLFSCTLSLATKNAVLSMYDLTAGAAGLANTFLTIQSFTVIGSSYQMPCLCGIVAGGGQTDFVFKNDLIFMWGMVIPVSILSAFVFKWPVPVTFFCLKLDQIVKCTVAAVKTNRFNWIRTLTR